MVACAHVGCRREVSAYGVTKCCREHMHGPACACPKCAGVNGVEPGPMPICSAPGCDREVSGVGKTGRCSAHARFLEADNLPAIAPLDDPDVEIHADACARLWAELLRGAISDAARPMPVDLSRRADIDRARDWFNGRDFVMVCSLIGLDPDYIRRGVAVQIAEARARDIPADLATMACRSARMEASKNRRAAQIGGRS